MAQSIRLRAIACVVLLATVQCMPRTGWAAAVAQRPFRNFSVAVYIPVEATRRIADPQTLRREFEEIWSQIHFNEVYLEVYRESVFAHRQSLPRIISFFKHRGIRVIGSLALARGKYEGRVVSFDWQRAQDVADCESAVRLAAHYFNTVFLDDFFFYNTRSNADIRAKGSLTWSAYRLRRMRWVANNVVLRTAREVNPQVRMIIKYPNWYEDFQGPGYDLDVEAREFNEIDTGDERSSVDAEQALQPYESYLFYRYLDNIRPGRDRGGWVNTFGIRNVDGYAEQIWDTLFAKAPEITLFGWTAFASAPGVSPGKQGTWVHSGTSFNWNAIVRSLKGPPGKRIVPGWASIANYSLRQLDGVLGKLGRPIGIASYRPIESSGEDYLQDYLGGIGFPINLVPHFPKSAPLVLLTADASYDPHLVQEIIRNLRSGGDVIITSGLLRMLERKGIESIASLTYTGVPAGVRHYFGEVGTGGGVSLDTPGVAVHRLFFPEIRFYVNDSWPLIRGQATAHDVPILLMTPYSRGKLYVLNVPFNPGDYYELPEPVLNQLRADLLERFPVRINAPARVSLFAYSNHTFIVESYRDSPTTVRIFLPGSSRKLEDLVSGDEISPSPVLTASPVAGEQDETSFLARMAPHSYRMFKTW